MSEQAPKTEMLERLKFAAMQMFPASMALDVEISDQMAFVSDMLCARISALVYGKKGPVAIEQRTFTEAVLPRWLPKRLRKRWTRTTTIRLDATPMLLFPDASFVPADKFGPAYYHVDTYLREVANPWGLGSGESQI